MSLLRRHVLRSLPRPFHTRTSACSQIVRSAVRLASYPDWDCVGIPPDDFGVDSTLELDFTAVTSSNSTPESLNALITHAFTPFTMSSVLRVSLRPSHTVSESALPSEAILKLFDRRCMANTREMFDKNKPHDASKELDYRRYLDTIGEDKEAADFDDTSFFVERDVSDGEFEGYLEHYCRRFYDAECSTYRRLVELQGQLIPRFYGTVEYTPPPVIADDGTEITMARVPGILIEYIPSITLRNLVQTWKSLDPPLSLDILRSIAESSTAVIDRVSDYFVLNGDARIDNVLVRQPLFRTDAAGDASVENIVPNPCVLIDLAQCRLRREDETDEDWNRTKGYQDEARAIGSILSGVISEHLGDDIWKYRGRKRHHFNIE